MIAPQASRLPGLSAAVGAAIVLAIAIVPVAASAQPVVCGQVLTENTTLEADLTGCPGTAIVIGADRVRLDLNGHTVSSACETDCAGAAVIDGGGGHDGVRILDGTIRPLSTDTGIVAAGIVLAGVDDSEIRRITVDRFPAAPNQPGVGISLSDSDANKLVDITVSGGDPAVLLSASDRNRIFRSSIEGGIGIHVGDAVQLADGSDENKLVDSDVDAEGVGLRISGSAGNRVSRNMIAAYRETIFLLGAQGTVIWSNTLKAGCCGVSAIGASSDSDLNEIRRNEADGELEVHGDGNRVVNNYVSSFLNRAIDVVRGDANLVRNNTASAADDAIVVGSAATRTQVKGNAVNGALEDGIDVRAPGTLIRANTATNNGELGINAVVGVIDGGGNRASGNGNPLQCLNVVCH